MNSKNLYPLILDDGDGRAFSQSFIRSEHYGTTASTVLSFSQSGNVTFEERTFGMLGKPKGAKTYTFKINSYD